MEEKANLRKLQGLAMYVDRLTEPRSREAGKGGGDERDGRG